MVESVSSHNIEKLLYSVSDICDGLEIVPGPGIFLIEPWFCMVHVESVFQINQKSEAMGQQCCLSLTP